MAGYPRNPQGDYLIPGVESPLWQTIQVPETTRRLGGKQAQRDASRHVAFQKNQNIQVEVRRKNMWVE